MKIDVTPDGVKVPKSLLDGVDTVEIRQEGSHIILIPLNGGPALDLGSEDTDETIKHILATRAAEARNVNKKMNESSNTSTDENSSHYASPESKK